MMLSPPDYTRQLDQIVQALNRSTPPQWVIALLSAAFGVIGTLLAQSVLTRLNEKRLRYNLQRVLYRDLARLFFMIDTFIETTPTDVHISPLHMAQWRQDQLATHISYESEKYLKQHQDVYMSLPEQVAADLCYIRIHKILEEENSMHVNASLARTIIARSVNERELQPKLFRCFLGREEADRFLKRIEEINRTNALLTSGPGSDQSH